MYYSWHIIDVILTSCNDLHTVVPILIYCLAAITRLDFEYINILWGGYVTCWYCIKQQVITVQPLYKQKEVYKKYRDCVKSAKPVNWGA